MKKLVDSFAKVIEAFLVILMALMVLVVFLATVGRYSQLFAIPWSEEFARYCMVAIVYLGLMLASLQERHFIVDLVPLLFRFCSMYLRSLWQGMAGILYRRCLHRGSSVLC